MTSALPTIVHHVDDAMLMSYAAGSLPGSLSAVVATHLAVCSHCRTELKQMECIGSVVMGGLAGAPLSHGVPRSPPRVEREAVDEGAEVLAAVENSGDVPAPLSRLVGSDLSSIRWKRLGIGIWHLPLSTNGKGDLRLIKAAPGQILPDHGHGGSELTLVLAGSYRDQIGRFGVGDIADLDTEVEHSPVADPETGCICVIASDEKARFKGVFARLVQPFTGM
jgi:putative transcriptional regulator